MPELPEVQTIVSDLEKVLPGQTIRDVWTDWPKMIKNPKSFAEFKKELIGKKILGVKRRGKNILIDLTGGKTLLIHQKMTGHLLYGPFDFAQGKWTSGMSGPLRDDSQNRFLHLVINLSGGKQLALSDVRKFAKVLIWETGKLYELEDIKNIGIEPMDKLFTCKKFKEVLRGNPPSLKLRRGTVRDVLMNQEVIAGIGNIYCSEILWEAGIYPFKEISRLKENDLKKIYRAILKILNQAVEARGDSMVDYRDISGKKGGYQYLHKAYHMEGEKCAKNDGGIVKRIKSKDRSAFYCPVHQKL